MKQKPFEVGEYEINGVIITLIANLLTCDVDCAIGEKKKKNIKQIIPHNTFHFSIRYYCIFALEN